MTSLPVSGERSAEKPVTQWPSLRTTWYRFGPPAARLRGADGALGRRDPLPGGAVLPRARRRSAVVLRAVVRAVERPLFLCTRRSRPPRPSLGFVIGSVLGLFIGLVIVVFPTTERIVYPYVVALQTVPKVAIAPLMVVWFGFGMTSKVLVVALVSLFPVLVNVIAGLRAVDQDRLDLLGALSASRWQVFRYLRFPNALPFIFAGLNTAIVFSVIGAIVGEFVGANKRRRLPHPPGQLPARHRRRLLALRSAVDHGRLPPRHLTLRGASPRLLGRLGRDPRALTQPDT